MIRLNIDELRSIVEQFNDPNLTGLRNTYANKEVLEVIR